MKEQEDILSSELGRDNDYEKTLRPQKLGEFIGQKSFIDNLLVYIQAAKKEK